MAVGTWHSRRERPRDTPSLREMEQLRVLALYEFEPPPSNQELVGALRACNNHTEDAFQYLKTIRRQPLSVAIRASAPEVTSETSMTTPEREKRRLSASFADESDTPSKRHKDLTFSQVDSEEKAEENEEEEKNVKDTTPHTQPDSEGLPTATDHSRAQQLLLQTVEDRVAARQPLRNPDWVNQVWASLQVPALLDFAMHLNLTVDALATWVKDVKTQNAQEVQTQGAALIVEVAANLPSTTANANDSGVFLPPDKVLSMKDEEVAAVAQTEGQAAELSAYARASAAKAAIECLSSACKSYMDRLAWFAQSGDKNGKEKAEIEEVFEVLSQKLTDLMDIYTRHVKEAEVTLVEAKQMKETRSSQILEFSEKLRKELLDEGETETCAQLRSCVEVWQTDDVEVQAVWSSLSECKRRVEESVRALKVAEHALAFHKNLAILLRKVRDRRVEALESSLRSLDEARANSEARATAALKSFIPMLTRTLCRYYEFHSIQQSKAKEELQKQEKALAAHNEYFGDSAPIKKGDIEQRIREFIGVTQSSMQIIMEIADGQQKLWEDKQAVLPESVRLVLIREFKALWLQLSGPMQDVMKKFVTTIEEAAGGIVAVEIQQVQQTEPEPAIAGFVAANTLDEQLVPVFTIPVFTNRHVEALTPYRTAISAIAAPNEIISLPRAEKERENGPTSPKGESSRTKDKTNATRSSETRVASSLPEPVEPCHEFAVGSTVYSNFSVGENFTQFSRGVVLKSLDNDMYLIQYDNGNEFSVDRSFLFTKELMEQSLKAGGVAAPDEDTEMKDVERDEHKASEGRCTIL